MARRKKTDEAPQREQVPEPTHELWPEYLRVREVAYRSGCSCYACNSTVSTSLKSGYHKR